MAFKPSRYIVHYYKQYYYSKIARRLLKGVISSTIPNLLLPTKWKWLSATLHCPEMLRCSQNWYVLIAWIGGCRNTILRAQQLKTCLEFAHADNGQQSEKHGVSLMPSGLEASEEKILGVFSILFTEACIVTITYPDETCIPIQSGLENKQHRLFSRRFLRRKPKRCMQ